MKHQPHQFLSSMRRFSISRHYEESTTAILFHNKLPQPCVSQKNVSDNFREWNVTWHGDWYDKYGISWLSMDSMIKYIRFPYYPWKVWPNNYHFLTFQGKYYKTHQKSSFSMESITKYTKNPYFPWKVL